MNNEFKKIKSNIETRYVLETATAGATSSGAVATSTGSVGKIQKRSSDNILAQEGDKDKVPGNKPRNFVAKNAKMGGAGQHRDKKKEQKQGKEKHRKPYMENVDNPEYNDEAGMAHSNLLTSARAVMGLLKTIKDRDNLPEWGQEKIAKAEMMLVSVWDYLQSQKQMGNDPQQDVGEGLRDPKDNPCWKGYKPVGTKQKGGRTVPNCVPKEGIEEGAEFGSKYAEQVAQQIFNKRQDISSEDEVLNQAYHIVSNDQGQKAARYMFNYDEDFPSDLVSAYFWLQKNSDGVTEYGDTAKGQKMLAKVHHRAADRVTSKQADKDPAYARKAQQTQDRAWDRLATKEEQGYDEVSPKSASYILRKLDQGVPMSSILDDFPELGRMMEIIAGEQGLHPDDDFEQIEDILMNDLEDIAAQEDDFGDYDRDEEQPDEYMENLAQFLESAINEKAVSKAQQRFMGMVHAAKKGEKAASPEVAKAAKGMSKKDAKDFAATKHKGLPEKKKSKK